MREYQNAEATLSVASRPTHERIGGVKLGRIIAWPRHGQLQTSALPHHNVRTNIYVDGSNLYFRCLRSTPCKWLDLAKLSQLLLSHNTINQIKYFTSNIKASPRRSRSALTSENLLSASQFPDELEDAKGKFIKPATW